MEEKLLEYLRELAKSSVLKGVYVIEFEGVRLVMGSKKSSWKTIGAAKNALRFELPTFYRECPDTWRDKLDILKKLEEEGIIRYVKIG